jgi:hypothetical protein
MSPIPPSADGEFTNTRQAFHTEDEDLQVKFGLRMKACRVLVNSPSAELFLRFAIVLTLIKLIADTFLDTEFLPYEPQPRVNDGIISL